MITINIEIMEHEIPFIQEHINFHESGIDSYTFNDGSVTIIFKWRSHARRFMDHIAPEVPFTPPQPLPKPKQTWADLIMDWLRAK